ncbi:dephospho-CoA kinase [Desmospora profundinema]|uniref:Dephospho-CoA kinase n=1 Tax=Desmospora profundinema TaxID=1571184 RepID=A0ABU1IP68_9BACL|nr:dephospho-CoA kinase [Desmospora profundinema]MDR6226575.1 dephospho-CoA kinase [Desmospora profundinema]
MKVGLTGGIATGKSTVSRMLSERGAAIVDADVVAREVVEPGTEGASLIRERFGEGVFLPDGSLDRQSLGRIIFADKQAREDLNRLLHPLIIRRMEEETARRQAADPHCIVVWDTPLLIEESLTDRVDWVVVVYIPIALQQKRLMERDGIRAEEARSRMKAQMSIEEKKSFADILIDNSGTLAETERQVDALWQTLVSKNGSAQP